MQYLDLFTIKTHMKGDHQTCSSKWRNTCLVFKLTDDHLFLKYVCTSCFHFFHFCLKCKNVLLHVNLATTSSLTISTLAYNRSIGNTTALKPLFYVCKMTSGVLSIKSKKLSWSFLTSRPPSTPLTTTFSLADYVSSLGSLGQFLVGLCLTCVNVLRRLSLVALNPSPNPLHLVFHRAPFWAHCCSYSTLALYKMLSSHTALSV